MNLFIVLLAVLWLRPIPAEEVQTFSSSEDISRINNLRTDDLPQVNIDPKLRRALLRVLTKLEEEDHKNGHQESSARKMAEVMQNIITEEDFIKYFQEQGLEKELLQNFQGEIKESSKENHRENPDFQEILSYSSGEGVKQADKPFTFASYPEDEVEKTTPENAHEFQNTDKYPSTKPTPSIGDAIYFQIPEPIHIQDSTDDEKEEDEENKSFNVQETRSIQGPTLVSPTDNSEYPEESQTTQEEQKVSFESQTTQEEQKVSFVQEVKPEEEATREEETVNFVKTEQPQQNELQGERDSDEEVKTEVDFQASNGTEIEDTEDSGNSSMTMKLEKHEVEFLHAPLLAAFTVQQDQQGLPRRVIPLNYQASGEPIPLPNNKDQQQKQGTQNQLVQQVKFLQDQQLQEQQYQRLQEFVKERQRLLQEETQRQLLQENQKRQYENEQRLALARQRQQQILHQNQQQDNQLEALKEFERQKYYQQQQNAQQIFQLPQQQVQQNPPQNVHFQKSVDFQFQTNVQQPQAFLQPLNNFQTSINTFNTQFQPSVELNRVNRHEPSNFIGNFGLSTPRPSFNFHSSGRSTVQPFVQPTQPSYVQPSNFIQNFNYPQHRFSQPNNYLATRSPISVDGQIQSLLSIAGIAGDLRGKPSAQEDLNIVSKVLALGHGEPQFSRQQFQASTKYEQVVEAPSRVIEPPKL